MTEELVIEGTSTDDPHVRHLYQAIPASALLAQSSAKKPFEPFFQATAGHLAQTTAQLLAVAAGQTMILTDDLVQAGPKWRIDSPVVSAPQTDDKIAQGRLALLARKYVAPDRFSEENQARLAILTEQARQLMPSVTREELDALDGFLRLVKEVDESDKEIRERLGIAPK